MMVRWANVQNNQLVLLCRLQTILFTLLFRQIYNVHCTYTNRHPKKKKNQHYNKATFCCTESKSSVIDDIHAHK